MAETLEKSAIDNGYEFSLFPATAEDVGACTVNGKLYIKCRGRPALLKRLLDTFYDDLIWMDIDCIIVAPLGDVLFDCDVAVTLRKIEERQSKHLSIFQYINCGVMFFKNNEASRKFIDLWEKTLPKENFEVGLPKEYRGCAVGSDDQTALNNLLLKHSPLEKYDEIVNIEGIKVKMLDARIYNFFYFPEDPNGAKVLHYKGFSFKREGMYVH